MVGVIVLLLGLPYSGPIRAHYPCETTPPVRTQVFERTTDGRPVKVAIDETSDKGKR
jgi:hypothetical protein